MERWLRVCTLEEVPAAGVAIVRTSVGELALFRAESGTIVALAVAAGAVVAPERGRALTYPVRLANDGSVMVLLGGP